MTNVPSDFGNQGYDPQPYGQQAFGSQGYDNHTYGDEATALWGRGDVASAAEPWYEDNGSLLDEHTAQHNFGGTPFIPSDGRDAKKILYVGATVFLSMAVLAALVAAIGIRMNQSNSDIPSVPTTLPTPTTLPPPTTALNLLDTSSTTTTFETTTTAAPTTTEAESTTTTTTTTVTTVSTITSFYNNCDDARAAGVAPMAIGVPGYRIGLDSDGDGIACNEPATTTTVTTATTMPTTGSSMSTTETTATTATTSSSVTEPTTATSDTSTTMATSTTEAE